MNPFLLYSGLLLALAILLKLPIVGHFVQHILIHLLLHVHDHHKQGVEVGLGALIWTLLFLCPAALFLGFPFVSLAAAATLVFLYCLFSSGH